MDSQYTRLPEPSGELDHAYGPNVHILSQAWPMSMLARLCSPEVHQPEINRLVSRLYEWLLGEVGTRVLERRTIDQPTRMRASEPRGVYHGASIFRQQRVVVVDVARAGMLPALTLYDMLHDVIEADYLRQDHLVASRRTNAKGEVIGIEVSARKVGGPVGDATVLLPDPMAATGTSLDAVLELYKGLEGGPARQYVAVHLIVTPEYLRRMRDKHPDLQIYAIRLDRGLSPLDVLRTRPGERWDEEVGLTGIQYIVPGAGGVGELLNNAWI